MNRQIWWLGEYVRHLNRGKLILIQQLGQWTFHYFPSSIFSKNVWKIPLSFSVINKAINDIFFIVKFGICGGYIDPIMGIFIGVSISLLISIALSCVECSSLPRRVFFKNWESQYLHNIIYPSLYVCYLRYVLLLDTAFKGCFFPYMSTFFVIL